MSETSTAEWSEPPRLSICIATRNRAGFIGETLESILSQIHSAIEIVIVDGASTDATQDVLGSYVKQHPFQIRYHREDTNSGVDADYDKAVGYARGEYCWLMPDDDLMRPGVIDRVLQATAKRPDLVIVDAEVRTADFATSLGCRLSHLPPLSEYSAADAEKLLRDTAPHLTFIGAAIVRRAWWESRNRPSYYGSLFIHVGVIFQQPPPVRTVVVAEPLITIRYGNAMWTPRYSEVWLFKWPQLIWSLAGYTPESKARVTAERPWRRLRTLLFHRAIGAYSMESYRRLLADKVGPSERLMALAVARMPGWAANALVAGLIVSLRPDARVEMHDVIASRFAGSLTRLLGRLVGIRLKRTPR